MLLGKESKWSVAVEIQEPSRSIHGKTQRTARISWQKSKPGNEVNHSTGEEDCSGMGELSRYLRQSTASEFIYSNE